MKKAKFILLSLLGLVLLGAGCNQSSETSLNSSNSSSPTTGRIVFSVTDAAANLNNINSVNLTISEVELQSAQRGWVTLSTTPKTFDLLELKESGLAQLLVDTDIPADTYNQIRLQVDKAMVTAEGQSETAAKLPSNTIKIVGKVQVNADTTSSIVLDFLLDQSLHTTGSGQFILLPVIKVDGATNADVEIDAQNSVKVKSGQKGLQLTVGTDISGETHLNLPIYVNLDLTNKGIIKAESEVDSDKGVKIDAQQAADLAVSSGQITTAISVQIENKNNVKVWRVTGLKGLTTAVVYVNASTGTIVQ